mmetsp:Transcript_21873/g.51871  ORF Transcript_21873/g.51871 Transcript_21873/m.51871 type:complete len:124 (-) Transcript_21873:336-707(-)
MLLDPNGHQVLQVDVTSRGILCYTIVYRPSSCNDRTDHFTTTSTLFKQSMLSSIEMRFMQEPPTNQTPKRNVRPATDGCLLTNKAEFASGLHVVHILSLTALPTITLYNIRSPTRLKMDVSLA